MTDQPLPFTPATPARRWRVTLADGEPVRLGQVVDPVDHLEYADRILGRALPVGLQPEGGILDGTQGVVASLRTRVESGVGVRLGHVDGQG